MLRCLSEKYAGQEFISLGVEKSGIYSISDLFTSKEYGMSCYPKGGDPEADKVSVTMEKYSEILFSDTYFGIVIREDFEADILSALSDLPPAMKVYLSQGSFSTDQDFDGTQTYADFKKWQLYSKEPKWFSFTIAVAMNGADESEKEAYANQMFDLLEKDIVYGSITVRYYPSDVFEEITRENVYDIHKLGDEYGIFSKSFSPYRFN